MNPNFVRFGILGLIVGGATALGYFLLRDEPKKSKRDIIASPVVTIPPQQPDDPGAAPEPEPNKEAVPNA
jgi:hypothetical protein